MPGPFLDKYGLSHLNVTHISQQFWCERQVELALQSPQEDTSEMIAGTEIHKDLMLEIVDEVKVCMMTDEDRIYALLLNIDTGLGQLASNGIARELRVFGRASGYPVSGVIDEIFIRDNTVIVLDYKTRKTPTLPPPASMRTTEVQVMLYRKLLEDLCKGVYRYEDFASDLKVDKMGDISPEFKDELIACGFDLKTISVAKMARSVFKKFSNVPEPSDYIVVRYKYQATGDHIGDKVILYDAGYLKKKLDFAAEFWDGKRKACKVRKREAWKCKYCDYKDSLCEGIA